MARATLTRYRQSPRKVRLVAELIRGKRVVDALAILGFTAKRAAHPLAKLLASAAANAVGNDKSRKEELIVTEVRVDEGPILYRAMPRARGRSSTIRKRTSHVSISVEEPSHA